MHIEQQDMTLRLQLDKPDPQQRRLRQIERTDKAAHGFPRRLFAHTEMFHAKVNFPVNPLHRFAVYHLKAGAQRLMAGDQPAERLFEALTLQLPLKKHRPRHVVALLRALQLVQNKQTLLRRRKRIVLSCLHHRDGRVRTFLHPGNRLRHLFHGGAAEHVPQREVDVQLFVNLAHQRRGAQGMPAEVEEIILHTDGDRSKHGLPDLDQLRFQRCPRGEIVRSAACASFRSGQRLTVDLPVRRQRQMLQLHEVRRNHVTRQFPGK